jgi:hypothetical protein
MTGASLLAAALGFLQHRDQPPEITLLRRWLDSLGGAVDVIAGLAVKSHEVVCRGIVHPGALIEAGSRQSRQIDGEDPRMNIHKNARLTPHGRAEVVRQVLELGRSARSAGATRVSQNGRSGNG